MIAITGATGQTGSKITNLLLDKKQKIRVIGRSEEKLLPLKKRGAEIAVGNQEDAAFLTKAYTGCDAVYLLIPPKMDTPDLRAHYNKFGDAAVEAIKKSGVKIVIFLSSLGAELESGSGPVIGLHDVEAKLRKLKDTGIVFLRPGYFMENTLTNASLIKNQHINGNTTPPNAKVAMIATKDIAKKAAELLTTQSCKGHMIVDIFGDKLSYKDATKEIGNAIGIPDLPYIQFTDADAIKAMTGMGLSENMAQSFVELSASIGKGLIHATQIDPDKPNTQTSFATFAKEIFTPAYKKAV
jgi:uncharacterized protein YbjT (DUF2867 family)